MNAAICLIVLALGQSSEEPGAKASETLTNKERYQRATDAALKQEIEKMERQLKMSEEELKEARLELRSAKKRLKETNKGRKKKDKAKLTGGWGRENPLEKVRTLTATVKEYKKRLRKLKKGEIEVRPQLRGLKYIEVGQIGSLAPGVLKLRVFQVLADDEMLVEERRWISSVGRITSDGRSTSVGRSEQVCVVMFRGVSTK